MAFCLKSVMDSYYFSLAIWNSKEYPNNYASAIRLNVICCGEWQKHNYYQIYYFCKAELHIIYYSTKTKYRNGLNAAPDMIIHLSNTKPNIKNLLRRGKSTVQINKTTLLAPSKVTRGHM